MHVKWESADIRGGRKVIHQNGDKFVIAWRTSPKGHAVFSLVHLDCGDIMKTDIEAEALARFFNLGRYKPEELL